MPDTFRMQDPSRGHALPAPGVEALRRLPFLAGAPDAALDALARRARWLQLSPGEMVVDAGDAGLDVFFVAEGTLRVVSRSAGGHEVLLNDLGAGEIIGEIAAIDGMARSANVCALTRARVCRVPGEVFLDVVLHTPSVSLRLLRLLAARVRSKDQRTLEAVALLARQRVAAELLRLSSDRGGGERRISPPPPQHELASRLGLRRETVSRELASLARDGLVTISRGALILHRPDRLRAEVATILRSAGGAELP